MKPIWNEFEPRMRRLFVVLAIAGALAAIAEAAVLAEHTDSDRRIPPSVSAESVTFTFRTAPADASVPAASEALKDVASESEAAPTF